MVVSASSPRFDTLAIQGGYNHVESQKHVGSICEPLYVSPAQHFQTSQQMESVLAGEEDGWTYTRIDNPTVALLESVLATLEAYGGDNNVTTTVFSSGMAAIFMASNMLLVHNSESRHLNVVLPRSCYGGSYMLFSERFQQDRGVELRWVTNSLDINEWEAKIDKDTRFVFTEVPSNPLLNMTDIPALADLAHNIGIPLMVDATIASPALMRPLNLGADIVVHSASKSMSASGMSIAGCVSSRPNIHCKFGRPEMREDFAGYLKRGPQRDMGVVLSPFNALMTLADLRRLRANTETMSKSAHLIAKFLESHSNVIGVNYPGLKSCEGHDVAKRHMTLVDSEINGGLPQNMYGYLISFRIKGGTKAARSAIDRLVLIWRANDLGRVKTTVTIPSISTHSQLSDEAKISSSVPDDLVRLSVGCEHADDLLNDLSHALN